MTKIDPTLETKNVRVKNGVTNWRSSLKRRLLASGAAVAITAGAFASQALSANHLFDPNEAAAARQLTAPVAVPGFSELVAAVKPAVVQVRVKADSGPQMTTLEGNGNLNPFKGTPFEKFFRSLPGPEVPNGMPQFGNGQPVQGLGSGFFVSADGYIVTNNHVVDHATKVNVVTDDGATYEAKVIGVDPKTDLALIKVDGHQDFPFVKLAAQAPKIGEWVVAMGNPFGLGGTVTAGIVSAEGRDIGSGPYDNYIQIDAPVNRGNSGGPTFNLKGEVIGVNTAIYSPSGGSVGIAFDIPAATVAEVIPELQVHGHVSRGWLGVEIQPMTKDIADSLGLEGSHGALVSEPQQESPAARAGLKSGDVITKLDGRDVKDAHDLATRIAAAGPGKAVDLSVLRDGHEQAMHLTLGMLKDKAAVKMPGKKPVGVFGKGFRMHCQILLKLGIACSTESESIENERTIERDQISKRRLSFVLIPCYRSFVL